MYVPTQPNYFGTYVRMYIMLCVLHYSFTISPIRPSLPGIPGDPMEPFLPYNLSRTIEQERIMKYAVAVHNLHTTLQYYSRTIRISHVCTLSCIERLSSLEDHIV